MKHLLIAGALLTAGMLSGFACGDAPGEGDTVQALAVNMRDIMYEPKTLTARSGEPVVMRLKNEGGVVHDLTMQELPMRGMKSSGGMQSGDHGHMANTMALHLALEAGKQGEVRFTPTKAGAYTYYCTVPGHREAGMEGRFEVRE